MSTPLPPGGPDPERVLAQALRAMAGGGKQKPAQQGDARRASGAPLSVLQIVLMAIIVGLLVGLTIGLISLLT